MYWCKTYSPVLRGFFLICLLSAFAACRPDIKETKSEYKYFDLRGFIRADSARLKAIDPTVHKTVSHNGDTQTRDLKIADWGHELSLFSSSDINKPSWRTNYRIKNSGDTTIYEAIQPELKTRRITLVRAGSKLCSISVNNHTKNLLYETNETLIYLPDSVYSIYKTQHVLFLGTNRYLLKGVFKK